MLMTVTPDEQIFVLHRTNAATLILYSIDLANAKQTLIGKNDAGFPEFTSIATNGFLLWAFAQSVGSSKVCPVVCVAFD